MQNGGLHPLDDEVGQDLTQIDGSYAQDVARLRERLAGPTGQEIIHPLSRRGESHPRREGLPLNVLKRTPASGSSAPKSLTSTGTMTALLA